jgi:hypothetical protein
MREITASSPASRAAALAMVSSGSSGEARLSSRLRLSSALSWLTATQAWNSSACRPGVVSGISQFVVLLVGEHRQHPDRIRHGLGAAHQRRRLGERDP